MLGALGVRVGSTRRPHHQSGWQHLPETALHHCSDNNINAQILIWHFLADSQPRFVLFLLPISHLFIYLFFQDDPSPIPNSPPYFIFNRKIISSFIFDSDTCTIPVPVYFVFICSSSFRPLGSESFGSPCVGLTSRS